MTEEIKTRVMSVLLKSLYKQKFISEDVYNHSLNNLPGAPDYNRGLRSDAAEKEGGPDGCIQNP